MQDASAFDFAEYARIINCFLERGYELVDYHDIAADQRHLVLRHDVDFSLPAALEMARLESARGWQAYYFILLRTEFYNPLSQEGLNALQELLALGHRVGLHFDASLYEQVADLPAQAGWECDLLASVIETPVDVLSLHRPHPDLLADGFEVADRLNAYSARYFYEIAYCSDSRGGWYHGHPLDHEAYLAGAPMQLLTHPIWWVGDKNPPLKRLEDFADQRCRALEGELSQNSQVWTHRRSAR